jgi:hypothetical protein
VKIMVGKVFSLLIAGCCISSAVIAPVPADPLELVTGPVQVADSPAARDAALQLLARARNSFTLRSGGRADGQGFDLKVSFTVNSLGQTDYDGNWTMQDQFDPKLGFRWTAAAPGYSVTEVSSKGVVYREGTTNAIPLRLQEARSALFEPIPTAAYLNHEAIRTSTANFRGATLTCVLFSSASNAAAASTGRKWEETEECIDPQSGLLQVHSPVPGHYAQYDYSNAPQFGNRTLPRKVTVTEAGQIVSQISVDSLTGFSASELALFVPTANMKAKGQSIAITSAQKISRISGQGPLTPAMAIRPICVFGLVNSSGQLVEAHSLQPSDPNSQAAVDDARLINFSTPAGPGAKPQQHFVFVIEKFISLPSAQ